MKKDPYSAWCSIERSARILDCLLKATITAALEVRHAMPNWESCLIPEHAYRCYDGLRMEADQMFRDALKAQERCSAFLEEMRISLEGPDE